MLSSLLGPITSAASDLSSADALATAMPLSANRNRGTSLSLSPNATTSAPSRSQNSSSVASARSFVARETVVQIPLHTRIADHRVVEAVELSVEGRHEWHAASCVNELIYAHRELRIQCVRCQMLSRPQVRDERPVEFDDRKRQSEAREYRLHRYDAPGARDRQHETALEKRDQAGSCPAGQARVLPEERAVEICDVYSASGGVHIIVPIRLGGPPDGPRLPQVSPAAMYLGVLRDSLVELLN